MTLSAFSRWVVIWSTAALLPAGVGQSATLVGTNATWKYLADGSDQGEAWRGLQFDDSAWLSGAAQLGYGEGDEATVISTPSPRPVTVYFRRTVVVPGGVASASLRLMRDDGAVVYVNGVEVRRDNLPDGLIAFSTLALAAVGGADESTFFETPISTALFVAGANIIAVEVHQNSTLSSDLSFALELNTTSNPPGPIVTLTTIDAEAREIPPWLDIAENPAVFRIARTGGTNAALSVNIRMSGTASNGVDYDPIPSLITIPAGSASADVFVSAIYDDLAEGRESVLLSIVPSACPECYTVGANSTATAYIRDFGSTNSAPTVWISRPQDGATFFAPANILLRAVANDPEDGYNITVEFFAGTNRIGTATFIASLCPAVDCPSFDLTWSNVPPGSYTLRAKATDKDGAMTLSEPVHITVYSAEGERTVVNVVAIDTQASENGSAPDPNPGLFAVRRSGNLTASIPVYFTLTGTAANGVDYAFISNRVVIAAGSTQTLVYVNPLNDELVEPTETVILTIDPIACVAIVPTPPECYVVGTPNRATVFIADANGATNPVTRIAVFAADPWADEGPAAGTNDNTGGFRIWREGNTNVALTVFYSLTGTAQNGLDYEQLPNNATLPIGASTVDVVVRPIDDVVVETNETVVLSLSPNAAYRPGTSNNPSATNAVVYIVDNDRDTNHAPSIFFYAPPDGAAFTAPAEIALRASASDPEDGNEITVEFFAGTNRLGQGTFVPALCPSPYCPYFALTWSNVPVGGYTLTAKATDKAGAMTVSTPIHITVNSSNPPPSTITLIATGSIWKYNDQCVDLGREWRGLAYFDGPWASGPAQLGYGDRDEATAISSGPDPNAKCITAYFRRTFSLANPLTISRLTGRLLEDDGAVVYLNGIEVFRSNMPAGNISFHTLATIAAENQIAEFSVPPDLLLNRNVVAVEMHQVNATSSDLSFDLELSGDVSPSNGPPRIVIVTPNDGDSFPAGTGIFLGADPLSDGVQRVDFYSDNAFIGQGIGPLPSPISAYGLSWSNPPVGAHALQAVVTDDAGLKGTSAPVHITVTVGTSTNMPPTITFLAPPDGTIYTVPTDIQLRASAQDQEDGYEIKVEFFAGTNRIGQGTFVPTLCPWPECPYFALTWSNVPPGNYALRAVATDRRGAMTVTGPVRVTVLGADRTVVTVVAADSNATEPGVLTVVDDGQFAIRRTGNLDVAIPVLFRLSGSTSNGVDYSYVSNRVIIPAGSTQAVVRISPLIDNLIEGTETVVLTLESPVCVAIFPPPPECYLVGSPGAATVNIRDGFSGTNRPPAPMIVTPHEGDTFVAGGNILIGAEATDDQGVQSVEFFAGNLRLGFANGPLRTPLGTWLLTWSNAPSGDHVIRAVATDTFGARGTSPPVNIAVVGGGGRELHAIGVYSGAYNGGASVDHERGEASVVVNRPGKHVWLFLSSYEPVLWHIDSSSDTIVEKVILGGYYRQDVDGIGEGVQVIPRYYDEGGGTSDYFYSGPNIDSPRFLRVVHKLCELTRLDLASFQGTGAAPYPAPFVIDQVQDDERLRCDYPQPVDLSQLPELSFPMSFFSGADNGRVFSRSYTLAGPQDGGRLLPGMRVVADADGRFYYGSESHEMWRIDSQNGGRELMDLGSGVPELSWPTGVAFDSSRNRVLLVSLGGEGHLYAYSPADNPWSLVSSMDNRDVNGLGYHAADDSIYAVANTYEDYHPRVLFHFDADGHYQGQIALPLMPFDFGPSGYETELVSVENYLVLLLEPNSQWFYGDAPRESRIYLIDPRTSQVWLTYRRTQTADSDGDGVPDDRDHCANTPAGTSVDEHGCAIAQQLPRLTIASQCVEEIRTNGCRLILQGAASATCVIECSTDLIQWTPIATNTLSGVSMEIMDPAAGAAPRRFYRVRSE